MKGKIEEWPAIIFMCFLATQVHSIDLDLDFDTDRAKERQETHEFIKEKEQEYKNKIHEQAPVPLDLSIPKRLISIWEIKKSLLCTKQTTYFFDDEMRSAVCQKCIAKDGRHTFYFYLILDDYLELTNQLESHPKLTKYTPSLSLKGSYTLDNKDPIIDRLGLAVEIMNSSNDEEEGGSAKNEKEDQFKAEIEVFPIVKIKKLKKPENHEYVEAFVNILKSMEKALSPIEGANVEFPNKDFSYKYKLFMVDFFKVFKRFIDMFGVLKFFTQEDSIALQITPHINPFIKLCKKYNDPYGDVGRQYAQLTFLLMRESIELKKRFNGFTNNFIPICDAAKKNQLWIGAEYAAAPFFNPHQVDPSLGELWQEGIEESRRQVDIYISRLKRKNILPHEILMNYEVNLDRSSKEMKDDGEKEVKENSAPLIHKNGEERLGVDSEKKLALPTFIPIDGKILALIPSRSFFGFVVYYKDNRDGLVKDMVWRQHT